MYYIGLDVHKETINYCVKDVSGGIHGLVQDFGDAARPGPMDEDSPAAVDGSNGSHAAAVKVAHPLMLRAIAVAKKKNDRIDANKIADCASRKSRNV